MRAAFALSAALVLLAASPAFAAPGGSLTASTFRPVVGQPVVFSYAGPAGPALTIAFGDGAGAVLPGFFGTIAHAYAVRGSYFVRLCSGPCTPTSVIAVTGLFVEAPIPRVPLGAIYATSVVGGPFLAGATTLVQIDFRILEPFGTFSPPPQFGFEAVVDLEDSRGGVVRRSDPFPINVFDVTGAFVRQQSILYTIPNDAKGAYRLRVYIRSENGGTVATGIPTPIVVLGAPDPAPAANSEYRTSGALVAGPMTLRGPFAQSHTATAFQSNLTTAIEWPRQTLSLSGLYDPVSWHSDAVLTLSSATPGPILAPDAQGHAASAPAGKGASASYSDVLGRTTASLPALLGGGDVLRGLDMTYAYADGWTYHGSAGWTQLGTQTTSLRDAGAVDITRAWAGGDSLRIAYFSRADDVNRFVPLGTALAQWGGAGVVEFDDAIARNVKGQLSLGASRSRTELPAAQAASGAADQFALQYALGSVSVSTDYHNDGSDFATGGGIGARADRAGGDFSAQASISPASSLNVSWKREDTRSVYGQDAEVSATFSSQPANGVGMQVTVDRERQLSDVAHVTTNTLVYNFARAWQGGGQLQVGGSATGISNTLFPTDAQAIRTADVAFSLQRGEQTVGAGLTSNVSSGRYPSATVGENASYGFGFGDVREGIRDYELQLSASGDNMTQSFQRARNSQYVAILSRHLTRFTALGLRAESGRHVDRYSPLDYRTSGVQLQFNINY